MTPSSARPSGAAAVMGGLVTGVGAAALSLLAVLALALAVVAAAPSVDGSVEVDWSGASDVAVSLWLLSFGVPAVAGDVTITWAPLGVTLLAYALTAALARRHLVAVPASWLAAVASMAVVVALVSAASASPDAWKGAVLAAAVGAVGCARGLARSRGPKVKARTATPGTALLGLRLGGGLTLMLVAAGAVTTLGWLLFLAPDVGARAEALRPDAVGGIALAVGQNAYLPNLTVWALAWLGGSPLGVGESVPGLPLLAALPDGAAGWWGFMVIVGVAAVARWRARAWVPAGPAGWAVTGIALACVAVAMALLLAIAGGSWGGAQRVGPSVISGAWAVVVPTAVGMIAAGLVTAGLATPGTSQTPGRGGATAAAQTAAPQTPLRKPPHNPAAR